MKNRVFRTPNSKILARCLSLLLVFGLVACKGIRPPDSLVDDKDVVYTSKSADGRTIETERKLNPYKAFNNAYSLAVTSAKTEYSDGSLLNADLLTEGMALIQANCSSYFTRLGNDGQHMGFARKETSLAGAVTAALMGVYDASTKVLSTTASAFGFTTATMDNFSDTYLFSPDIKSVQALVMSALDVKSKVGSDIVTKVKNGTQTLTYTEASQFLLEMESTCQPHGVRSLITAAVDTVHAVPAFPDTKDPNAALRQSIEEVKAAAEKAKTDTSSVPDKEGQTAADKLIAASEEALKSLPVAPPPAPLSRSALGQGIKLEPKK